MKKADAVVIGFGKGGKTLAAALAAAGKKVFMVEQSDKMYGGTCINVACIPTKALVHSAGLSAAQGGDFKQKSIQYKAAIEEKNRLIAMLREKNYQKLVGQPTVEVFLGRGSFMDAHHVRVDTLNGMEILEGEQIFINTGARPFIPSIPGLRNNQRVYTSETLLELKQLPARLVIIGGGYIGIEFASMYANFGSEVTVIQDGEVFLPREDQEIAEAVLHSLQNRGIRILRSAKVLQVEKGAAQTLVLVEGAEGTKTLPADAVLVATGRRPNVEGLHLEAAGIELTPRGAVKTDETLRTTVPHIFALGDVTGGLQFTYISLDDFRIVKSQLLGDGSRTVKNRGTIPHSVFLDPPFSRVGLTEAEAEEQGYKLKIAKLSAAAIPKAQILRKTEGLLKVIIDAKTDLILGAHLFCAESHEMINLMKLAIDAKIPFPILRENIYTHPTMSEVYNDLFSGI